MEIDQTMAFTLTKTRNDLVFRRAALADRTWLTDHYLRVRLVGEELRGFTSPGADDHIRVFFPPHDQPFASVEQLRAAPSREYTPLTWDPDAGELELEFVGHDGDGVGATWAWQAPIGAPVGIGGPRGSTVLQGRPDVWFLAGDETAIPAIRRFLALAGPHATGRVLIEVPEPGREVPVAHPSGVELEYVHRKDLPAGEALIERLNQFGTSDRPTGDVFVFIAAERSVVKPGRALALDRWGLDPDQTIIKGYWARGNDTYHAPH